ncbi:MAG: apolipoprotein N-acyltransferase [Candidatus Margulisiibacteriota bacterium]
MSALSGILAAFSFPKFNLFFLAWIALVPLLLEIKRAETPRKAARSGFIFGLVFFGINLFWINTLNEFAPVFATLGYIVLIIGESAFTAAACFFIKYFDDRFPSLYILAAPLAWMFFEWLRMVGPFGISAGDLGYSQATFAPIVQIASFGSVFAVSFFIVFINCLIAEALRKNSPIKNILFAVIILALACWWGTSQIKANAPSKTLTVSIIQGDIPQWKKLNAGYNEEVFSVHEALTRNVIDKNPDIIIWPESVVLDYLLDNQNFMPRLKKLSADSKAYIITGTPYYDRRGHAYNSLVAISPSGEVVGRYDKQRLVPFGEYLPFRFIFYPMLKWTNLFYDDFSFGPSDAQLISVKGVKFGPAICFESTFPDLVRDRVKKGADVLLTVTNDAWFRDSSAIYEHIIFGILRAVENRKYFIQVGNTGISALIDPYGRIIERTKPNKSAALTFKVPLP